MAFRSSIYDDSYTTASMRGGFELAKNRAKTEEEFQAVGRRLYSTLQLTQRQITSLSFTMTQGRLEPNVLYFALGLIYELDSYATRLMALKTSLYTAAMKGLPKNKIMAQIRDILVDARAAKAMYDEYTKISEEDKAEHGRRYYMAVLIRKVKKLLHGRSRPSKRQRDWLFDPNTPYKRNSALSYLRYPFSTETLASMKKSREKSQEFIDNQFKAWKKFAAKRKKAGIYDLGPLPDEEEAAAAAAVPPASRPRTQGANQGEESTMGDGFDWDPQLYMR